uniref:Integrase core domain-containing protein n=1 Tax=Strigamia maritima TaxID=126957 RepID=T1IU79_STRMM
MCFVLHACSITEMWDQVRVDHGREFFLTLYMQEINSDKRVDTSRASYRQTQSKKNLRAERFWPEVNSRVNYPIKTALLQLVNSDELIMEDEITKFCVSSFAIQLCRIGTQRCVESWNAHTIPGVGSPIALAQNAPVVSSNITENDFPDAETAANMYAFDNNRQI